MESGINYDISAPVFNIQPYSIHDGPGIRVTVFIKGCPLRCLWCANPESRVAGPQLMEYSSRCTLCGRCEAVCPAGAIRLIPGRGSIADRTKCTLCASCAEVCPSNARELCGREMTVRQVLDRVLEDKLFLDESGGGMTLSGGEPLFHPDFSAELLAAARALGIHTAVESCAFASPEAVYKVFRNADLALLDIKHMDSAAHERCTGVPNQQILENIRRIRFELSVPVILRLPVIPGFNDSEDNIKAAAAFALSLGGAEMDLLPYHRLGVGKADALGMTDIISPEPPSDETMERLKALAESCGASAKIGG